MTATMLSRRQRALQRLQVSIAGRVVIPVDALHVQCPLCLYVFFMDEAERRMILGNRSQSRRDG